MTLCHSALFLAAGEDWHGYSATGLDSASATSRGAPGGPASVKRTPFSKTSVCFQVLHESPSEPVQRPAKFGKLLWREDHGFPHLEEPAHVPLPTHERLTALDTGRRDDCPLPFAALDHKFKLTRAGGETA